MISRQVPCCLVRRKGGQWSCFWTERDRAGCVLRIDKSNNSSPSILSYCTNASKATSTPPCRVVDPASRVPKDRRGPPRRNPVGPTSVPHIGNALEGSHLGVCCRFDGSVGCCYRGNGAWRNVSTTGGTTNFTPTLCNQVVTRTSSSKRCPPTVDSVGCGARLSFSRLLLGCSFSPIDIDCLKKRKLFCFLYKYKSIQSSS